MCRTHFINKESWIFNLTAAYEKLRELEYRADDGKIQFPITVADTVLSSSSDLYNMRIECENLLTAAHTRPVTAEEYKRISQLVHWRAGAVQAGQKRNREIHERRRGVPVCRDQDKTEYADQIRE